MADVSDPDPAAAAAPADDDSLIAEVEAKLEALKLRLPDLEGKANKRERTQVNKDIYALENDDAVLSIAARNQRPWNICCSHVLCFALWWSICCSHVLCFAMW